MNFLNFINSQVQTQNPQENNVESNKISGIDETIIYKYYLKYDIKSTKSKYRVGFQRLKPLNID